MKKKRERLEVIHDILYVVQSFEGIGPTKLLRKSNLSPQMFDTYLKELIKKELIEEKQDKKKKVYCLTENGARFIERYKVFSNFIDEMGL